MQGLFNPDNNWEIALLAFIALCPVLAVVLPVWLTQRSHGKKLDTVREHVANSHSTNLRDDIDRVLDAVASLTSQVGDVKVDLRDARTDIADVRRDLRLEREERINGDRLRIEAQSINITPGG
ncbi:minor tail protein [Mycobacterium phage LoneWolf]|nr:minor tail protein [Mycobacterium phage LoneWolf]